MIIIQVNLVYFFNYFKIFNFFKFLKKNMSNTTEIKNCTLKELYNMKDDDNLNNIDEFIKKRKQTHRKKLKTIITSPKAKLYTIKDINNIKKQCKSELPKNDSLFKTLKSLEKDRFKKKKNQ